MKDGQQYNYENAGFNGFLRRTIASNVTERTLKSVGAARAYQPQQINFDATQVAGPMGDKMLVGNKVQVDGAAGRINIRDNENNTVVVIGDVEL